MATCLLVAWIGAPLVSLSGISAPVAQEPAPSEVPVATVPLAGLCSGCHTPPSGPPLAGRLVGRWLAPNITPDPVSGVGAWSREDLFAYLRHGRAAGRGQAGGPMAGVVEMLQSRPDQQIFALVDWMLTAAPHRDDEDDGPASEQGKPIDMDSAQLGQSAFGAGGQALPGAALYNGACASCHGADGAGSPGGQFPSLFNNSSVGRERPYNLVAALLEGIVRHGAEGEVFMQSFDGTRGVPGGLSDDDLAKVSNFVLEQFGARDAPVLGAEDIRRSRTQWWGEEEPTVERGELLAVGGGPGSAASPCFSCHGLNGQGDAGSATPHLAGMEVAYFVGQMRHYASGARQHDAMTAIAQTLDDLDYQSLALYYAGLPPATTIPIGTPGPGAVATGEELYLQGDPTRAIQACADCHGVAANGFGAIFPSVVQPASYTAMQLRLWQQGARTGDPHDLMAEAARDLTEDDIRALSVYLEGLAP